MRVDGRLMRPLNVWERIWRRAFTLGALALGALALGAEISGGGVEVDVQLIDGLSIHAEELRRVLQRVVVPAKHGRLRGLARTAHAQCACI